MSIFKMEKSEISKNEVHGITKTIENILIQWTENISILDLSGKNLKNIEESIQMPPNIVELNLSRNDLKEIPHAILIMKKLRKLDVSHNKIVLFDDEPEFLNIIENLNLSYNALIAPPHWVWAKAPEKLNYIDLSENMSITQSVQNGYLEYLVSYTPAVTEINLSNCYFRNKYLKLISTLVKAQKLTLGTFDYKYSGNNYLIELPCDGLDNLCDIKRLTVSNTHIYTINTNINIYKNLVEIDLSHNYINIMPDEFCSLQNLEICIFSYNKLLYLPDNICELQKLKMLCLDNNELCTVTENLCKIECLQVLDLYNNYICDIPDTLWKMVSEIDVAQNYFDELEDTEYVAKKQKLRLNKDPRDDGRKIEITHEDSDHNSPSVITDDDDRSLHSCEENANELTCDHEDSSSENWDSDSSDHWVPFFLNNSPKQTLYKYYIMKKMEEGNFCPIDLHATPVIELLNNMESVKFYEEEGGTLLTIKEEVCRKNSYKERLMRHTNELARNLLTPQDEITHLKR